MPYFNRFNCLPDLIKSVLEQTHSCWELILVDDCSKDSEKAKTYIEQLNNLQIHYIRHQVNLNGAQARNTGIDHAQGQYVAFLDSDDTWKPNKLATQLAQLESLVDPDNTILYGALEKQYPNTPTKNLVLPERGKYCQESVSDYLFLHNGLMQTSTFFLSVELARKIKFNPELVRHQDYDFVLRAEAYGAKFEFTQDVLCFWVCLPGEENITRKGSHLAFSIQWYEQYKQYMTKTGCSGYLTKQMFYIAVKSKEVSQYYRYIYRSLGGLKSLKVIWGNIKFVVNRR